SESPAGLARREPLDIKRREQPLLVPGALRVAQEIHRRAKRHEHLDHAVSRLQDLQEDRLSHWFSLRTPKALANFSPSMKRSPVSRDFLGTPRPRRRSVCVCSIDKALLFDMRLLVLIYRRCGVLKRPMAHATVNHLCGYYHEVCSALSVPKGTERPAAQSG